MNTSERITLFYEFQRYLLSIKTYRDNYPVAAGLDDLLCEYNAATPTQK